MPYIDQISRGAIQEGHMPTHAGELNYLFTEIIKQYMLGEETYQRYNDCIGALEACKLELYRRKVSPYEDTKIEKNGDVY